MSIAELLDLLDHGAIWNHRVLVHYGDARAYVEAQFRFISFLHILH
jgi:hypothetical protein